MANSVCSFAPHGHPQRKKWEEGQGRAEEKDRFSLEPSNLLFLAQELGPLLPFPGPLFEGHRTALNRFS
ncbi:hypothetical protein BOO91_19320 [Vibrio navarrensis]|nr:hypothetical protein [Vibrio navarrensis]